MKKEELELTTEIVQTITAEQAYNYRMIPVAKSPTLKFFVDTEELESLQQELQIILNQEVVLEKVGKETVDFLLRKNYRKKEKKLTRSALQYSDDFLLSMIHEAKNIGSSDIHFETFEKKNLVRFRIDGKLIERYTINHSEYPKIVNRIKIMGGLDISEKRLPQDGRINIETGEGDFDIRVSSLPTLHGEKLVLRILSKNSVNIQLDNLGFTEEELNTYKSAVKKPNGIVLISGPTGSGKTTTLYATLKLLNTSDTNILTIEDPVEYTLEGINQVQLKESIGLNFASTLRTFLRQDPDIIMVGEIRDVDTANMAIRASLTGHLVLSTIHTNSAWATVSRLIDMGVPPFLIASTLNVSVAQRLVRKLCPSCKVEEKITDEKLPKEYADAVETHFVAKGCSECYHTGYRGRKAIYEIIPITKKLVKCIEEQESDVSEYLKENKIATLKDNAISLVANGTTSIEEIYPLLIS